MWATLSTGITPRTQHHVGLPPQVGSTENQGTFDVATVLLLLEGDHGVALERYADDGSFTGDTWHESVDAARKQAEYEFPGSCIRWATVPEAVANPVDYVLECTGRR
jgi:hypothetical protein